MILGPDTKNFEWGPWGEFGECEGNCGEMGLKIRHRPCIPPSNGGFSCPTDVDAELETCEMALCPGKFHSPVFILPFMGVIFISNTIIL